MIAEKKLIMKGVVMRVWVEILAVVAVNKYLKACKFVITVGKATV
jgi:hypothetical protein